MAAAWIQISLHVLPKRLQNQQDNKYCHGPPSHLSQLRAQNTTNFTLPVSVKRNTSFQKSFFCCCTPVSVKRGKYARRTGAQRGLRWSPDKITPEEGKLCAKCPCHTWAQGPVVLSLPGPWSERAWRQERSVASGREERGSGATTQKGEEVGFLRHTRALPSITTSTHQRNSISDRDASSWTRKRTTKMLGKREKQNQTKELLKILPTPNHEAERNWNITPN